MLKVPERFRSKETERGGLGEEAQRKLRNNSQHVDFIHGQTSVTEQHKQCLWWKNTAFHLSIVYLCPRKTNASRNGPGNQGCHFDWCQKLGPSHSLMIDSEAQNGKH